MGRIRVALEMPRVPAVQERAALSPVGRYGVGWSHAAGDGGAGAGGRDHVLVVGGGGGGARWTGGAGVRWEAGEALRALVWGCAAAGGGSHEGGLAGAPG